MILEVALTKTHIRIVLAEINQGYLAETSSFPPQRVPKDDFLL
jgi:hypothetical protein